MKEVIRSYCVFVLLGMPKKGGFRLLVHCCRRARTVLYAERLPLAARLTDATLRLLPPNDDAKLWELSALAEKYEGKFLTLIPATKHTRAFTAKYRTVLEEQYRIGCLPQKSRKRKGTDYETGTAL